MLSGNENYEDISLLIAKGESETVEFKKSTSLMREAVETVCAFTNRRGGYLIFGVLDNGTVVGVPSSDDTLRHIVNEIKLNTDPKLYPSVEHANCEDKSCIVVTVEESPLKPHLAYGRTWIRVGPTNQKMDRHQYESMLQQRQNGYGFDFVIQPNASIADIDSDSLLRFLETANAIRSLNENLFLPADILLEKLELMRQTQLTRAGLLLFGKRPTTCFEGCFEVRCGSFLTDDGYDEILNNKEFKGNLLDIFENVYGYVIAALRHDSIKMEEFRKETPEFPFSVIREAIVNMIVHRDYRLNPPSRLNASKKCILRDPEIA